MLRARLTVFSHLLFGAALFGAGFLAPGMADALPLDKQACEVLKAQHEEKLTPEMQEALEHGPDWVKNNLTDAQIDKVRAYLMVEEKLEFQCRKGRFIRSYIKPIPLPDRKPGLPVAGQKVVSTSQARLD